MLAGLKRSVLSEVQTKIAQATGGIKEVVISENKKQNKETAGLSSDIDMPKESQANTAKQQTEMWKSIRTMQEAFAVAETPIKTETKSAPPARHFDE